MEDVQLKLNENGFGHFYIMEGDEQLGKMEISINGPNLTVYHTEVADKAKGKGYGKKLLNAMVDHARVNKFKVIPLCPYVHAQFLRNDRDYRDLWEGDKRPGPVQ
jgi:predicted GNAT family acetyltransferase